MELSEIKSIIAASCPLPKLDFDIITLGHGSGGLLTHNLLEQGVFDLFSNSYLDKKHDGAIVESPGDMLAFSTDSFVVSPIFFPGGNIGELAINGTVNDINMCGAKAEFISLAFIIEEGLAVKDFWDILLSIKAAAEHAGVKIVTGDTKVVERGKGDKIFINTSGIGQVSSNSSIDSKRVSQGDKVILSGSLARHGIAIMSVREGLEFESAIESDTCHFNHIIPKLIEEFGRDIHMLRDATRGGIATVLNEVAKDSGIGVALRQNQLHVDEDVSGACELLGLDPLYVANEGVFVVIASPESAEGIVEKINAWSQTNEAGIIGEVVSEHTGQVVIESAIGGKRVVNMMLGEQLPRIC
ncbi:MAG: hydrogenase expression/formation protein HypE [Bacteroidetes bacterium]|jgi:hydrogenase expression/formation protein HypE|nr:hydrogenase expression/formation protein HypE [Bacteroidota bacterium]